MSVCNSEFETMASGLLGEMYETDQDKSHELLTQELQTWHKTTILELADDAELMDFMKHDCCQTKLDAIWHKKLSTHTAMWQVRVLYLTFFVPDISLSDVFHFRHLCLHLRFIICPIAMA